MKTALQRGFTLLELTVVLACVAILSAAFGLGIDYTRLEATSATWAAKSQKVYDSHEAYVTKYYTSLVNGTPIPGVAVPLSPTFAELSALNLMPANFSNSSNVGVAYVIDMAVTPTGCAPINCDVTWSMRTAAPPTLSKDGQVDMHMVAAAAAKIERGAGWSSFASPAVITGLGGWSAPNPAGSVAGIILARGSYTSSQYADFIRIRDTRDPDLKGQLTVAGAITTSNNVTASGNVTAAGLVQGSTVNSTGSMTAAGTMTAANGRASLWDQPGEGAVLTLRDATGQQMHLEQINGKMRWVNGPWSAEIAAIDQGGNLNTAGRIDAAGTINAANGRVKIAAAAWAGWGCNQSSESITTDPNGKLLTCESGTWRSQQGGTNWYTAAWWSQNWTGWQYNGSGRSQLIQASTDIAPRDCGITGVVDPWGTVAQQFTAEDRWSASCFVSFMVPPGRSWYVSGGRYGGTLNILTWVFTL